VPLVVSNNYWGGGRAAGRGWAREQERKQGAAAGGVMCVLEQVTGESKGVV
jgi:hypothetical protein